MLRLRVDSEMAQQQQEEEEIDKTQLFTAKGVSLYTFEDNKWVKQGNNGKIKLWIINKETHNDKFRIELQWIKSKSKTSSYWLIPSSYADKQNNAKQCVVQYRIHRSQLKSNDDIKATSFTLALTFKNAETKEQFKKCIFVDIYSMNEDKQKIEMQRAYESSVSYSESESWSIYDQRDITDNINHIKNKHSHSLSKQSNDDNQFNNNDEKQQAFAGFKDVSFITFGGFEFAKTSQDLSHTDSYKRFAMLCPHDILENNEIYTKFISSLKNLEEETSDYIEIYNPYTKLSPNLSTWMCYRCCLENPNKYQNCRLCGDVINYYQPDKAQENLLLIKIQHLIEPTNYKYKKSNSTLLTWIPSQFRIKLNKSNNKQRNNNKNKKNNYYVTIKHEIDGLNNIKYRDTICKYIRMVFSRMIPMLEWIQSMKLNTSSINLWKLNIVVSLKTIYIPSNKIESFHQFMHEGYKHECVDVVGLYFFDINIPEQYESVLQIEFVTSTVNEKIFSSQTKLKKERFDITKNGSCVVFNNKNNELFYRYKLSTKAYRYDLNNNQENNDQNGNIKYNASFKVLSFMMLGKKYNRDDIQRNVPDAPLKYRTVLEIWCKSFKLKIVDIVMDLILLYFKQRAKENNRTTRMKDTSLSSLLSTLS